MVVFGGRAVVVFIGNCDLKNICDVQKKELEALIKRFKSAAKASTLTFSAFRLLTCTITVHMQYVLVLTIYILWYLLFIF